MPKQEILPIIVLLLSSSLACADEQPAFYIDKGACPFECCTYGNWVAKREIKLYTGPDKHSAIAGTVMEGATVHAQTGEVQTKPGKLIVRRDTATFRKDDVLWVYTYLGEGYYKIWYQGEFVKEQVNFDIRNSIPAHWGYFEVMPDSVWWAKVRMPGGLEGWTDNPWSFSGKDACR